MANNNQIKRIIPSSGEALPVIGMGSWQTFDTDNADRLQQLTDVLEVFHKSGSTLIDSSPMYGRSEQTIGELTSKLPYKNDFFYATKVWTTGAESGITQMKESFSKMKRKVIDLMQVHNLTDWKVHLPVLQEWKAAGKIRYIGVTHYTSSSHEVLESIMRKGVVDFIQFNYSLQEPDAEKRLLDAAAFAGVATLINRPFGGGSLIKKLKDRPLPEWATAAGIHNWGAFLLKYIIARPEVTCVIPASGDPLHITANFEACVGALPDEKFRAKMLQYIQSL